jgi:hypothetical protein
MAPGIFGPKLCHDVAGYRFEHKFYYPYYYLSNEVGLVVDIAENSEEALKQVETSNYELILMDMQMPVMGGPTAKRLIRELTNTL